MADQRLWIGAYGRSALVDRRALGLGLEFQREEFLVVLGSEFFSPCLDRSFREEFQIVSRDWRERV